MLGRLAELTPAHLEALRVKALLLDVDNTLTTHNNPVPDPSALEWIAAIRAAGIKICIASNNRRSRVEPFAASLGLSCVFRALKPIPLGFLRAARRLGLKPGEFAVVGDQIFTDVLGGNLFGAKTVLLRPIMPENGPFFRLKRRMETEVIKKYRMRG
jgi:HAD superfamily phosphatase (TIGR01668 family)